MKLTILFATITTSLIMAVMNFSLAGAADVSSYRLVFTAPGVNQDIATPVDGGFMYSDYNSTALTSNFYVISQSVGNVFNVSYQEQTANYATNPLNSWRMQGISSGDINGDGTDDVVMCTSAVDDHYNTTHPGVIMLSNGKVIDLQYQTCVGNSTLADVDHDGFADIITHGGTGFETYNTNGALTNQVSAVNYGLWSIDAHPQASGMPVVGRFDQGGYNGLFFIIKTTDTGTDYYRAFFTKANGDQIGTYNLGTAAVYGQASAVDIDGNGADEVVVASSDALRALRPDGSAIWTAPSCSSPVVGNVSADASLQVLCVRASGSDSIVDAYNAKDGQHVVGYPLTIPNTTIRGTIVTAKLASSHTTNDLLIPTTHGLMAYRGSDLQNIWTIQGTKWCDGAKVHSYGDGVVVQALCGDDSNSMANYVYELLDNGQPLSESIQNNITTMSGYDLQQSHNFDGAALSQADGGYRLVARDGGVFPFGNKAGFGSTGNIKLWKPIVGMAETSSDQGYWLVASDGGIFPFGDARGYGSTGGIKLWQPIVGMERTSTNNGYWLVASDGGIFPFGDARGYGSTGGIKLNKPIVGMAATPTGNGYWLVASDGGIFPFGDANGYGSTGNIRLTKPIVGMAATSTGKGYWLVASDGGIFPFGDAVGYGSAGNIDLWKPIVGMKTTPTGKGYWLVASDGGMFTYGDAKYYGSTGGIDLWQPIVGMGK